MSRTLKISFMGAFFVALLASVMWVNINRPRVMVLHSYSNDYIWTREINVGLDRILKNQSWMDVRYHYMETKKHPSKDYKRRVGISVRKVIENSEPDIVIAVDDNAQKLAAKFFVNHPKVKIIFAGINGSIEPYGYDKADNVTGILERKPVRALVEMMSTIATHSGVGKNPRAIYISDNSHSAERDGNYMKTQNWNPVSYIGHTAFETFGEWQKFVLSSAAKADFLLVGGYRSLYLDGPAKNGKKKFASSSEVAGWTEANSPIPVIGMNVFNSEDGVMASVGVSPYEQGEVAAQMTVDILSGNKTLGEIEVQSSKLYVVSMRQSALEKRNIQLPKVFETFARTTNNFIP